MQKKKKDYQKITRIRSKWVNVKAVELTLVLKPERRNDGNSDVGRDAEKRKFSG